MTNEEKTADETDLSQAGEYVAANKMTVAQRLAIRKAAGLQIDPETAVASRTWGEIFDPYGVDPNLPDKFQSIGSIYFACSPASGVWVAFCDLPEATRNALWEKLEARKAFPEPIVYRQAGALCIEGSEDDFQFVRVRIEQVPKLIEKMRSILKELGADAPYEMPWGSRRLAPWTWRRASGLGVARSRDSRINSDRAALLFACADCLVVGGGLPETITIGGCVTDKAETQHGKATVRNIAMAASNKRPISKRNS